MNVHLDEREREMDRWMDGQIVFRVFQKHRQMDKHRRTQLENTLRPKP